MPVREPLESLKTIRHGAYFWADCNSAGFYAIIND
jgi:hypothetical protein